MRIKTGFPHPVREIENTWIPLSDGSRLAARIWLPVAAEDDPVPAILEYLPYRKNDATTRRDAIGHPYFAGHGYASVRVDMRGSGDSDGLLLDEYLPQEQDDALEVLSWIAEQPWCTGAIGMIGISWGGFNGLQIAARRPPELKAVISLCSTDDRYADDVHYMGGCLLASDMLSWASSMLINNARPPDPRFVGERWREMWLHRLEHTPPFIRAWLSHQRRDAYWKQGSVCEDYAAIDCPVYVVGGWADAYTNAIPRLLEGLSYPRKGLIGPWSHNYPHSGIPGPAIGFLQECLRWWDYWLKGIDTGIMNEPMLRAWMLDSFEPKHFHPVWPGRWVAEPTWPRPDAEDHVYILNNGSLDDVPQPATCLTFRGTELHGISAGGWCSHGWQGELPTDQRPDDGSSLSFTSAPLDAPMEILGFPEVTLRIAVDRPVAFLAVRLCDVAPTGVSTLVSWGMLNLTHRDGHEHPKPLEPGEQYAVSLRLNAIAYSLPAGHRWRVAVSPTYWPHAWPSPETVTLSVFTGDASRLLLPIRTPREADADLAPFGPPEGAPPLETEVLRTGNTSRFVRRDVAKEELEIIEQYDKGGYRVLASGLEYDSSASNTYSIVEGDPLSAKVECHRTINMGRDGWRIELETSSVMTADADNFYVTNVLDAYEGNTRVFTKTWDFTVERDSV